MTRAPTQAETILSTIASLGVDVATLPGDFNRRLTQTTIALKAAAPGPQTDRAMCEISKLADEILQVAGNRELIRRAPRRDYLKRGQA